MRLFELSPAPGSTKERFRKGRGHASGNGKQAGKGHKGQKARSGGGVRPGFEGGQMPLARRLPKRGFTNHFSKNYTEVTLAELERFENGTEVTPELLLETGVISKLNDGVVVLSRGELTVCVLDIFYFPFITFCKYNRKDYTYILLLCQD